MTMVLIIGGYGVFGGLLAKRLLAEGRYDIAIAGRSHAKASQFCEVNGGTPVTLNRTDKASIIAAIKSVNASVIIDAAGPFDDVMSVVEAAIESQINYIDLADNADFVSGITRFHQPGRDAGIVMISGASSVPCISSAAVEALSADMQRINTIDAAIIPGNRAPRGLAVIKSILDQAGKPFAITRNGTSENVTCWGDLHKASLHIDGIEPINNRWTSFIRVPDTDIFPTRFQAKTVTFRAGLELRLLHGGLWLMAWLPRLGLIHSLRPISKLVQTVAQWFEHIGSDRGGMFVEVEGVDRNGAPCRKRWTLIAEEGDGPNIPATPAYLYLHALTEGSIEPGAHVAMGHLTLDRIEHALAVFQIKCAMSDGQ